MIRKAALTYRFPHKAEPYAEALRQAGIEPIPVAPDSPRNLDGLQGLLITGGTDLNSRLYGQDPHSSNEAPDDPRDELELRLLQDALDADLPVLAICRGMQLFNVGHGGSLIQDLPNPAIHAVRGPDPSLPAHQVIVEPRSRLAAILGQGVCYVNSRHHQAVDRLGAGLRITATSPLDGVIEGIERDDRRFAIAVQWHPEDQIERDAQQLKLFLAFAEALESSGTTVPGRGSVR